MPLPVDSSAVHGRGGHTGKMLSGSEQLLPSHQGESVTTQRSLPAPGLLAQTSGPRGVLCAMVGPLLTGQCLCLPLFRLCPLLIINIPGMITFRNCWAFLLRPVSCIIRCTELSCPTSNKGGRGETIHVYASRGGREMLEAWDPET